MHRMQLLAGAAAVALGLFATHSAAEAAVVQVFAPQQLSATPISFTLGTGTFSFTADNSGSFPMSAVTTIGSAGISTSNGFFGTGVTDFGGGAPIDGTGLFSFASYSSPATIPSSAALDFVGFSYGGTGGTHYGYAEVFGSSFVGYAYETAANTTIFTQQVPEPASAALLVSGLAMVGLARRKKRGNQLEASA